MKQKMHKNLKKQAFMQKIITEQRFYTLSRYHGRGDGVRTHDLSVPNAARYQLRYASKIHFAAVERFYSLENVKENRFLSTETALYYFTVFRKNSQAKSDCIFKNIRLAP